MAQKDVLINILATVILVIALIPTVTNLIAQGDDCPSNYPVKNTSGEEIICHITGNASINMNYTGMSNTEITFLSLTTLFLILGIVMLIVNTFKLRNV